MIPNINPNNNLSANFSDTLPPSAIVPALAALNQESHEPLSLDDRVSKKSRTTPLTETVHYPPDDARESYEGEMLNGKYHGNGHLINKDGSSYKGEFKEGIKHGKGILLHAPSFSLISTEGEFVNGEPINGKIKFRSGNVYTGPLKNKKLNGQGTLTFSDGAEYVGEFKDSKMDGFGTFTCPNGTKYIGGFQDNKKSGSGTITYSNGSKFSGEFKDGKRNGWGALKGVSGYCEGLWVNDVLDINNKNYHDNIQKLF